MHNNNTKTVVKHFDKVIYASIINEQSVNNKKAMMASKRKKRRAMVTHGESYFCAINDW